MGVYRGIDVSEHNGDINWKAIPDSIEFAIIRASYGSTDRDSRCTLARAKAARAAGKRIGFYHYAYPSGGDALAEARNFVKVIKACGGVKRGDIKPTLDIEESKLNGANTHTWCCTFVREVKRLLGTGCLIYTGSYWRDNIPASLSGCGCPLWLAAYVKSPDGYVPAPWRRARWGIPLKPWSWAIWQYSSTGRVRGVPGDCDMNVWKTTWTNRVRVGWPSAWRRS